MAYTQRGQEVVNRNFLSEKAQKLELWDKALNVIFKEQKQTCVKSWGNIWE